MNDRVGLLCLVVFTGRALGMIRLGSLWLQRLVFAYAIFCSLVVTSIL
jgi:hypothetical protein